MDKESSRQVELDFERAEKELENLVYNVVALIAIVVLLQIFTSYYNPTWNSKIFGNSIKAIDLSHLTTVTTLVLLIATVTFLIKIRTIHRLALESIELRQRLESSKDLVNQYRTTQHEFLNHLQVIYGFVQINQAEKALEYIKEYDIRFRQGFNVGGIARPEVAAIIISKMTSVMGEGTKFRTLVSNDLSRLPLRVSEAVSVVGNLLQNALEAVQKVDEPNRYIEIEFSAMDDNTQIRVSNRGPVIPKERIPKLFEYGYSTKDNLKSGVGLALVKNIVDRYHGRIGVDSREGETTFRITIPNQDEKKPIVTS